MAQFHVTLYTGPETEELEKARKFLACREIKYQEKNIVTSPGARGELKDHTHRCEYPAIDVDGHFVLGFFPEKWEHLFQEREFGEL